LHGPQDQKAAGWQLSESRTNDPDLSTDFHNYWVNLQPDKIITGIDDMTLGVFTPSMLPPGGQWVFNKPMFVTLNIAVGGNWPGPPDIWTPFPATMLVDWFEYKPSW
jgi:beta-glucanase (GH16 family)